MTSSRCPGQLGEHGPSNQGGGTRLTWEVSTTSKEGLGTRKGSTLQAKGMLTEVFCQIRIERKCGKLKSSVTCVVELARVSSVRRIMNSATWVLDWI